MENSAEDIIQLNEKETVSFDEAANFLFVRKEYMQKLLERGKVPYCQQGEEKRIFLEPLKEYDRKRSQQRHEFLNRMAKEAQELGIYWG